MIFTVSALWHPLCINITPALTLQLWACVVWWLCFFFSSPKKSIFFHACMSALCAWLLPGNLLLQTFTAPPVYSELWADRERDKYPALQIYRSCPAIGRHCTEGWMAGYTSRLRKTLLLPAPSYTMGAAGGLHGAGLSTTAVLQPGLTSTHFPAISSGTGL